LWAAACAIAIAPACVPDSNDLPTLDSAAEGLAVGGYTLRSASALCVGPAAGASTRGTALELAACAGDGPRWQLDSVDEDTYELVADSGLCADVTGRATTDHAKVQIWTCNHQDNQRWHLVFAGDAQYQLVAVHSGKCLHVVGDSGKAGADLEQLACAGGAAQRFTRTPTGVALGAWVRPGGDGHLAYKTDDRGDRIPDFSHVGYRSGGVAIPDVPVKKTLAPAASGDDGARIQAALDAVGALSPDSHGVRGAVLLAAGTYRIGGNVVIKHSGVVLRGAGRDDGGTLLIATGKGQRSLVRASGSGAPAEVGGTRRTISDAYVPVGATRFHVADPSPFHVGDRVIVRRPSTQEWIDFVGMDDCKTHGSSYDTADKNGSTCLDNPWEPGSKDLPFDRTIVAIAGTELTIDAPITTALDHDFGGGVVFRYTFAGRLTEVGVEDLRGDSDFASATDEDHGWTFVELSSVEDAWVRRVTSVHYGYGAVTVRGSSRAVTVEDSDCLDPVSQITGGRRYSFLIDGDAQLVLMQRLHTRNGRHDFVLGASVPGPNVFLDGTAEKAHADIGPHHRWSAGALFDNITSSGGVDVQNRGNSGTGHGWAGANMVFWRVKAGSMNVQSPPGAHNWAIGAWGAKPTGSGTFDATGVDLWPPSLYLEQLEERLGPEAVRNLDR
jgi:Ricin-type beta-trefoil lectin domain